MPEEAYISDILAANGRTDSTSGPYGSVALDSGCADRDTFSSNPGSVPLLGAQVVATGVGPGVGSPTALWSLPRTASRGC